MAKGTKIPLKAVEVEDNVSIQTPSGLELRGTVTGINPKGVNADDEIKVVLDGVQMWLSVGSKARILPPKRKPLPTEPGVYRVQGASKPLEILFRLDNLGGWWRVNRFLTGGTWQKTTATKVASFSYADRLIPISDPAQRKDVVAETVATITKKMAERGFHASIITAVNEIHDGGHLL